LWGKLNIRSGKEILRSMGSGFSNYKIKNNQELKDYDEEYLKELIVAKIGPGILENDNNEISLTYNFNGNSYNLKDDLAQEGFESWKFV
jgi:hypothetical protein